MTSTRGTPSSATAYWMLPSAAVSTVFPALRTMKSSPSPRPNKSSGGTRESEQDTSTAKGVCPFGDLQPAFPAHRGLSRAVSHELLVAVLEQLKGLVGCQVRLLTRGTSRCERPRANHHAGGQRSAAGAAQETTARQVRDHSFFLPVRASRMVGSERELYRGDRLAGSDGGRVKLRPSASHESRRGT